MMNFELVKFIVVKWRKTELRYDKKMNFLIIKQFFIRVYFLIIVIFIANNFPIYIRVKDCQNIIFYEKILLITNKFINLKQIRKEGKSILKLNF